MAGPPDPLTSFQRRITRHRATASTGSAHDLRPKLRRVTADGADRGPAAVGFGALRFSVQVIRQCVYTLEWKWRHSY